LTEEAKQRKCIVAVRIRGIISAKREARETLQMLHLTRNNYTILIDDRPSFLGMLQVAQHYTTWGEVSKETLHALIEERGRLLGNKRLTEEYLQKNGHKSLKELADAVFNCQVEYWKLPNIQPVFKLHPPTKGFKRNIKKSYKAGGESGYRAANINELVKRMF
jgi:large subunit ribosomal protein L30